MAQTAHHQRPESWSDTATRYEAMFMPFSEGAAAVALEMAALASGERFLDIAAGTGALTFAAAARGANVVSIDFSEGMLEVLRGKLAKRRVEGVETHVMDGQKLTLEDKTFDVAGSNFGLIFFPDIEAGLREMHRVLRPGGRGFVTSMVAQAESPLMRLVLGAMAAAAPGYRPSAPPATIGLSTSDAMLHALSACGLTEVRAEQTSVPWAVTDAREFWDSWVLQAPPTKAMMDGLDATQQAAGREAFSLMVAEWSGDNGPSFPTEIIVGIGSKPA